MTDTRDTLFLLQNGFVAVPYAKRSGATVVDRASLGTVLSNIAYYGYTPSVDLLQAMMDLDVKDLASFWVELDGMLAEITGTNRNMDEFVVYKNFPDEVLEMSQANYWFRQICMYIGLPNELFTEEQEDREPLSDDIKLKVLDLAGDDVFDRLCDKLIALGSSWQPNQIDAMTSILKKAEAPCIDLGIFGFRANGVLLATEGLKQKLDISVATTSATDVLRIAAGVSDADVELKIAPKFRKFSRPERRMLIEILENCADLEGDFARRPEIWKRLLSRLHPGDYKCARVSQAYTDLYAGSKNRLAARLEHGFASKDLAVLDLLVDQPGIFMRELHRTYGLFGAAAFEKFKTVTNALTIEQLLKLSSYLKEAPVKRSKDATPAQPSKDELIKAILTARDAEGTFAEELLQKMDVDELAEIAPREDSENGLSAYLVRPKGNWSKALVLERSKPSIDADDLKDLQDHIGRTIGARVNTAFPQGIDLDLNLYDVTLPTNGQELASYGRGTEFDIPEKATFVRTASFWSHSDYQNTWFDNGWNLFDEDWKPAGTCCWDKIRVGNGKNTVAIFSGDPTNSKDLKGRGCQMIDLYIDQMQKAGVAYAVWNILCYSSIPFEDAEEVLGTLQWGENPMSGKLYEPSRAQMVFPLKGREMTKFVAYIDVRRRKLVYMDAPFPGHIHSAVKNADRLSTLMPAFQAYTRQLPTIADLFANAKKGSVPVLKNDDGVNIEGPGFVFDRRNVANKIEQIELESLLQLKSDKAA